ncbi:alkylphosphonate utilization protein [Luteolibacter ambystomatis]|uniref:Alkylphosphonate utilization protein n=1 Tax=Luteolibacter ambystomatis TaxID=2824561 RepID=A0A975PGJ9_9BACT|nr:zinc ribbon domain-containing protein YjdM [Luteolibacter ambystomatis]QUE52645.1 alkylphosphonate utilization protein [Luteolibacter ambystomatis]
MSESVCPICDSTELLDHGTRYECVTCGHEWAKEEAADEPEHVRVVKDAYGNILADGDIVAMIKDLKLGGTSEVLKTGAKSKPIRLVDGDHEISCKMNGISIALKACYVKKVQG